MKKLLLLLTLLIPGICLAKHKPPKFQFGQCVIITNYFYEGCQGIITEVKDCAICNCYEVEINCKEREKLVTIDEDKLKKCGT